MQNISELFRTGLQTALAGASPDKSFARSLARVQNEYLLAISPIPGNLWNYDRFPKQILGDMMLEIIRNEEDELKDFKTIFKYSLRMDGDQLELTARTLVAKYSRPRGEDGAGGAGPIVPAPRGEDGAGKSKEELDVEKAKGSLSDATVKRMQANIRVSDLKDQLRAVEAAYKEALDTEGRQQEALYNAVNALDRKRKRDEA